MHRRLRTALAAVAVPAALLLSACGTSSNGPIATVASEGGDGLHGTDVSDVIPRPAMALPDTTGTPFRLRDRPADELTVLFFGYTRCPDICPTTMADLAAARRLLPAADRPHLKVVMVTEDPATDTAPVLRRWLDRFDPSFTGLTGGDPASQTALEALRAPGTVVLQSAPPGVVAPATGTTVQHASSVYAFHDKQVVVWTDQTSPADYAADFSAMLRG